MSELLFEIELQYYRRDHDCTAQECDELCIICSLLNHIKALGSKVKKFYCLCAAPKEKCFTCLLKHHEHESTKLTEELEQLKKKYNGACEQIIKDAIELSKQDEKIERLSK